MSLQYRYNIRMSTGLALKLNLIKLLFGNVSLNFTLRHEIDVVVAIYISFIKLLLYIKHGQTKGLQIWSNLLKFVINVTVIFGNIIPPSPTKNVQKKLRLIKHVKINTIRLVRFKKSKRFRWHLNFNFSWHKRKLRQFR